MKRFDKRLLFDIGLLSLSILLSVWLFSGSQYVLSHFVVLSALVPLVVGLRIFAQIIAGVYRSSWRFVSPQDVMALQKSIFGSAALFAAAGWGLTHLGWAGLGESTPAPLAVFSVDAFVASFLLFSVRLTRRLKYEQDNERVSRTNGRPTLIYGAGRDGKMIAQRFSTDPTLGLFPVGFIDDDVMKKGKQLAGCKVYGGHENLPELLKTLAVKELIVAISDLDGDIYKKVLEVAHSFHIRPRKLAGIEVNSQDARNFEIFRDIELADLLNRPRVAVDLSSVQELIKDQVVLVTGGGGSIGSELSRQLINLKPRRLLVLDHSEYNLYAIEQELRGQLAAGQENPFVPILLDIKDKALLSQVMQQYRPKVLFHAAAYKHVHLAEGNPFSTIMNNVLGMRNLLEVSQDTGVENFVLISTDKAVNAVGVMGTTKRVCELMVAEVARQTGKRYCAVRFGNVLGSSGSFIPLLKQQIRNGGPVTITHPDMARYFMLIREAVALVLKAGSISKPGDINILRMGPPIKIVDVAKSLITLLGKNENEIPIVFTGIRPGEKLCEELYLCGKELETEHSDILVLPNGDLKSEMIQKNHLASVIEQMLAYARSHDPRAVKLLNSLVEGKAPPAEHATQAAAA